MNKKVLKEKLAKHEKWLNNEKGGERLNLTGADSTDVILRGTNLRYANLTDADLTGADLTDADLTGADLGGANLTDADLRYANLSGADLGGANLTDANLRYAILRGTNLRGTNLRYAKLKGADLGGANLTDANLRYASYEDTILNSQCPEEGSFIGFKKLKGGIIAKLRITENSKRSSATSRKCRAEEVEVLEFLNSDLNECSSNYDNNFIYTIGETIKVDNFNDDRWNECATGIHFFITKKEAEEY